MKLIQVVGYANTGKTTFILDLIQKLCKIGNVAVIKHIGGHIQTLEEGKDTTRFFEAGAFFSAGLDAEKAVVAIHDDDLEHTLRMLADAGVEYAVIEGFKRRPLPKIVLGDLEAENCILRNPTGDEVIAHLENFADYVTLQGLVHEIKREHDVSRAGAILTFNGIVREWTGDIHTEYLDFDEDIDRMLAEITAEIEKVPGILGVRFHHHKGRLFAGDDITYLAILAEHRYEAFNAASAAIDRLKRDLHDKKDAAV
ncbi:MAG: molybdopterin-guanine dinucleotide biosynthesis protein B [Methanomicrobiaceae archaeon]|nr:molybdopterin-guanine dinucleotide biosynthesis protein B [Methanomicrobiaceae archaeon]